MSCMKREPGERRRKPKRAAGVMCLQARKNWWSTSSTRFSLKSPRTRTKECTKISSSVWNCTTKPKTVTWSAANWLTFFCLSVSKTPTTKIQFFNNLSLCVCHSSIGVSGEKLSDQELDEVVKDCLDPEDEDGMIPYVRK